MSSPAAAPREVLIRGASPTVRASFEVVMDLGFEHLERFWLLAAMFLVLGMFFVLVWSEWIFKTHSEDACDQPLAMMLRMLNILFAFHAFEREIVRHLLRYDPALEAVEPFRVRMFRSSTRLATILWPIVGTAMLFRARACSAELKRAVQVVIGYYAFVAATVVILPACFLSVLLCLVRRGLVSPRRRNAAPEELLDELPIVEFDAKLFESRHLASSCSICLDAFCAEQPIVRTPCTSGHIFHAECLRGWLQCARTCPLCRQDLTVPGADDPEAGLEMA